MVPQATCAEFVSTAHSALVKSFGRQHDRFPRRAQLVNHSDVAGASKAEGTGCVDLFGPSYIVMISSLREQLFRAQRSMANCILWHAASTEFTDLGVIFLCLLALLRAAR
jgi:hypothetical protein